MRDSLGKVIRSMFCKHEGGTFISMLPTEISLGTGKAVFYCSKCESYYEDYVPKEYVRGYLFYFKHCKEFTISALKIRSGNRVQFTYEEAVKSVRDGKFIITPDFGILLIELLKDTLEKNRLKTKKISELDQYIRSNIKTETLESTLNSSYSKIKEEYGEEVMNGVMELNNLVYMFLELVSRGSLSVPVKYYSIFKKVVNQVYGKNKGEKLYKWEYINKDSKSYYSFTKRELNKENK